jgi:hypothetical protein
MTPRAILAAAFLLAAALLTSVAPAAAGDAKADPKTLFTQLKCNTCHAIASQAVAVVEEEEEAVEEDEEEAEPPDLSGVGLEHQQSWLKDWLLKKVEKDDGKKHRKKFEGKPGELDVLTAWLATLKDAPPKKKE